MLKKPRQGEGARRGAFTGKDIAARVRKYHEIGNRLREESTKAKMNRSSPVVTLVPGASPASVRVYEKEYRRFARVYTSEELEELLQLRSKKQGTPLGWGIVRKLMAVTDKAKRRKLELRAANESWSVRQTDAFVREKILRTRRSKGARPLAEPKNLTELLQRLGTHAEECRRRLSHWTESPLLNPTHSITKVSGPLRARALAICDELRVLVRMARDLSSKLESIAAGRPELAKEGPVGEVKALSSRKSN